MRTKFDAGLYQEIVKKQLMQQNWDEFWCCVCSLQCVSLCAWLSFLQNTRSTSSVRLQTTWTCTSRSSGFTTSMLWTCPPSQTLCLNTLRKTHTHMQYIKICFTRRFSRFLNLQSIWVLLFNFMCHASTLQFVKEKVNNVVPWMCLFFAPGGSFSLSWPGWLRTRRCRWSSCTEHWRETREKGWVREKRRDCDFLLSMHIIHYLRLKCLFIYFF